MREKENTTSFFEENDKEVCRIMCNVLLGMFFLLPILYIFSALGIFKVTVVEILKITPLGIICTLSPKILYKRGMNIQFLKYYSIFATAIFVMSMAMNANLGIYI